MYTVLSSLIQAGGINFSTSGYIPVKTTSWIGRFLACTTMFGRMGGSSNSTLKHMGLELSTSGASDYSDGRGEILDVFRIYSCGSPGRTYSTVYSWDDTYGNTHPSRCSMWMMHMNVSSLFARTSSVLKARQKFTWSPSSRYPSYIQSMHTSNWVSKPGGHERWKADDKRISHNPWICQRLWGTSYYWMISQSPRSHDAYYYYY